MEDARFDSAAAAAARDAAVAQVADHAADGFMAAAAVAIERTARTHHEFIVDEVWKALGPAITTHEKRAMGAAMGVAHRAGIIKPTDRFMASAQTKCHHNPRRVWRSLLLPHEESPS